MPMFEYQCRQCGEIKEVLVFPESDEGAIICAHCGSPDMERILSAHTSPPAYSRPKGQTCCGREERCEAPPCSTGGSCSR